MSVRHEQIQNLTIKFSKHLNVGSPFYADRNPEKLELNYKHGKEANL